MDEVTRDAASADVCVPDIGDYHDVPVIEILVRAGDVVGAGDPLVILESDKATLEVPAPAAGVVRDIVVAVGDRVSAGSSIVRLVPAGAAVPAPRMPDAAPSPRAPPAKPAVEVAAPRSTDPGAQTRGEHDRSARYCGPAVRRMARELGVDLQAVDASGPRGRIVKADVLGHVRKRLVGTDAAARPRAAPDTAAPKWDFAKFGPVEVQPLSRIRRISAVNLARNWATVPHVTNHHDADVTEIEEFRRSVNCEGQGQGVKVTLLAFVMKACAAALRAHPAFNASLDGDNLVLKQYVHLGFAVDTAGGLVVPVVRDADRKGVLDLAREAGRLAERARAGQLKPEEMQGGCFTISSLGAAGGRYFTPIINAPEVAILGLSAAATRPAWNGREFVPRMILPLSLSWDHRALDGAAAAQFNHFLVTALGDIRRLLL